MRFRHEPVALESISSTDTEAGRYYDTPGGRFPSVTTVIGWHKGTHELDAWRRRVGEDEAHRVGVRARLRGTAVHALAESYMLNQDDWARGAMPTDLDSFEQIRPLLDAHVGRVMGVEVPLWSARLRTAGRTDLLAEWDGVNSIIDFKTSTRQKTEDKIWGYFVQKTCYGEMVEELTGIEVPQIVTLMMVDDGQPQVWIKRRSDYVSELEKVFIEARRD